METVRAALAPLDRPIGWQLLVLPCSIGIAVARIGFGFFWQDLAYAGAFLVGAIAIANPTAAPITTSSIRTSTRKSSARASGRCHRADAREGGGGGRFGAVPCWLGVLLTLPTLAQIVSLIAIPLVALYPLMKRITWWPQASLGIVFSWGALVGGATATYHAGVVPIETIALYAGCICWTIGYDTIYALQDRARTMRSSACARPRGCLPTNGELGRPFSMCWRWCSGQSQAR